MLKLEIGGGDRPKGEGFVNMDIMDCADVRHDLEVMPWPFEDDSVDEIYTSHCIEHVRNYVVFLQEIARICKVGSMVDVRCPDATSEMALCPGHAHVISINCIRHVCEVFPGAFFTGRSKRLRLVSITPRPDDYWFPQARQNHLFAGWSAADIMTWLPRTRHENQFIMQVIDCDL